MYLSSPLAAPVRHRHTVPTRITKCTKFGQLILRKIIKIVATRCQILRLKCTKFLQLTPAYSAPPDSLAGFKGHTYKGMGAGLEKPRFFGIFLRFLGFNVHKSNLSSGPDGLPPVFFKRLNRHHHHRRLLKS